MSTAEHWQTVYTTKPDAELSWFQDHAAVSCRLVERLAPSPTRAIDIGGGQSALAAALLELGIGEVAVLDIAPAAIERAQRRLGASAGRVRWIVGDVLETRDLGPVDLWHDRAVFHFLTAPDERRRYADIAAATVVPGGHVIIATFAPDGPERCSGLAVQRYDPASLAEVFGPAFEPVESLAEQHATPWGREQAFTYVVLRRLEEVAAG